MCCISRPVQHVARTRIFARPTPAARQVVVYAMEFAAEEDLAMILPLPVKPGADAKAFKFINLSAYPEFFRDMSAGFPAPAPSPNLMSRGGLRPASRLLEVVSVGAFEASFVPTLADFGRLDARFRIEPAIWRSLPGHDRMGFAVFKLKAGRQDVHPMAFSFLSAHQNRLFFPTLHIHDGKVHARENFDHDLYAQGGDGQTPEVADWEESRGWAGQFMRIESSAGVLDNEAHVYRRRIRGDFANEDILVKLA